ncbi:hypothetical protein HBB16_12145 [Pseudonocardia sp. MCCB 268]|nr:hypothetical protein [Pseudonocardia cytotoxica]
MTSCERTVTDLVDVRRGGPVSISWSTCWSSILALLAAASGWRHGVAVALLSFLGPDRQRPRPRRCWPPRWSPSSWRAARDRAWKPPQAPVRPPVSISDGSSGTDPREGTLRVDSTLGARRRPSRWWWPRG